MSITSYTLLTEHSAAALEKRVKDYINRNWQPLGGVVVIKDDTGVHYIQAMVQC